VLRPLVYPNAVRRVASVVAGVLLAVGLSAWVGFTWWSLGITIAIALAVGYALNLGEHTLEVPVSAMLILSDRPRTAPRCPGPRRRPTPPGSPHRL
jgi:uncharacterized membrane protein YgaE (UPF0421/DUF939 family)